MMSPQEKIIDKQVGRNAELFARKIAVIPTKDERYGYLRILSGIIEQAHPEWMQAPKKPDQIAHLVHRMSSGDIDQEEVREIVRLRDEERGLTPKKKEAVAEKKEETTEEAKDDKKDDEQAGKKTEEN